VLLLFDLLSSLLEMMNFGLRKGVCNMRYRLFVSILFVTGFTGVVVADEFMGSVEKVEKNTIWIRKATKADPNSANPKGALESFPIVDGFKAYRLRVQRVDKTLEFSKAGEIINPFEDTGWKKAISDKKLSGKIILDDDGKAVKEVWVLIPIQRKSKE
jgi:hypothetical protein